jgi:DNA invertase Pin-like site-specific DNA recombinase
VLIGYARPSRSDPDCARQLRMLVDAGCLTIFTETARGGDVRFELGRALDAASAGDVIVAARLDRLARSLPELVETIEIIRMRALGFKSLAEHLDADTRAGRLIFHVFAALAAFERDRVRTRDQGVNASPPRPAPAPQQSEPPRAEPANDHAPENEDRKAKRGERRGAKPKLGDDDLDTARSLLQSGAHTVAEVAARLGVSRPTLYRYLPKARTDNR